MRLAIRDALKLNIADLKEVYEPNIPNKETEKPYAVTVFKDDTKNGETVGYKRNIEVWFYDKRLSFKSLDKLSEEAIKALNLKVITDPKTGETFTCRFDGIAGQDIVDEEWNANAKGLKFTVIALHDENEKNTDMWLDALSKYTSDITDWPIYLNTWKSNFQVPSILWRVTNKSEERFTNCLIKENKTLVCHAVSDNKAEIEQLISLLEDRLIADFKIPLIPEERRYLTVESIREDREADMITKGQLTVDFFRRKMIKRDVPVINKIVGRGNLKE